jgi:protease I
MRLGDHDDPSEGSSDSLAGRRYAILAADSADGEVAVLRDALIAAGAAVERVQPGALDAASYDGLVAVGTGPAESGAGTGEVAQFVRAFFSAGKPVAVLGGAVPLLLDADVVRGRTVTCVESLRSEILEAGGNCVAYPVVADHGLVTGATAGDAKAFATRAVVEFAVAPENPHDPRSTAPP